MQDNEAFSMSLVHRAARNEAMEASKAYASVSALASGLTSSLPFPADILPKHENEFETLDIILPQKEDYEKLMTALEDLITIHQEERQRYSRSILLLQVHWRNLGMKLSDSMSSSDWLLLCRRMNVPKSKSEQLQLFRDYEKQLNKGEGMIFSYVGEILEDIEGDLLNDPCDRIWKEIVATDPIPAAVKLGSATDDGSFEHLNVNEGNETVSAVAFLSFIRSQQKEPKASLEDATSLIQRLNNQISWGDVGRSRHLDVAEKRQTIFLERLGKAPFISYLLSDHNDLMDPENTLTDMSKPLSQYWIHASHDTYLSNAAKSFMDGGQFVRKYTRCDIDEQMYLHALQRGIRYLELDVWDGSSGEPVICRFKPSGTEKTIPLAVALLTIRDFLKYNGASFPVILHLENHCCFDVQQKVAQQITSILGLANLLAVPSNEVSGEQTLPSLKSLQGKVLIMGKRPAVLKDRAAVFHDDYDDDCDGCFESNYESLTLNEEKFNIFEHQKDPLLDLFASSTPALSDRVPLETVVSNFVQAADAAKEKALLAEVQNARLQFEAAEAEKFAVQLTQESAIKPSQLKAGISSTWAAALQSGDICIVKENNVSSADFDGEGLEVQEFLQEEVSASQIRHSSVIAEAIEASEIVTAKLQAFHSVDDSFKAAERKLQHAQVKKNELSERAQKALFEAQCKMEHAESAKRRVSTVNHLLESCKVNLKSARTALTTATTEANVSERRAAEARARAACALSNAERDRCRSDAESRKAERMEEELSEVSCVGQLVREKTKSVVAMLKQLEEEIEVIASSRQFQKDCQQFPAYQEQGVLPSNLQDFQGLEKHSTKIADVKLCKDLVNDVYKESSKAEGSLHKCAHEKLKEKAQLSKIQADIALEALKQADYSAMIADEFAEHAEEESNAAKLRLIARKKAESNVKQQMTQSTSVLDQLNEAKRAAAEASVLASASRKCAESLAKQLKAWSNDGGSELRLQALKVEKEEAYVDYETARVIKDEKFHLANATKRVAATNAEVYTSAIRDVAAVNQIVSNGKTSEHKATVAYEQACLIHKQADHTGALAKIALVNSQEKELAAKKVLAYKDLTKRISAIPLALATITWFHITNLRFLDRIDSLPCHHVVSMASQALASMHIKEPERTQQVIKAFTRMHLCCIFPSCADQRFATADSTNFDPLQAWSMGCQIVPKSQHAQSPVQTLVGEGRFRQNKSCGYVLKPPFLTNTSLAQEKEEQWRFRVLRGSYLPKPVATRGPTSSHPGCISPYVEIILWNGKKPALFHKTAVVHENGLNPIWDESEGFTVSVAQPSIEILSISVFDQGFTELERGISDKFIAGAAFPISHLRQGYRSVALFDSLHVRTGTFAHASVLVHCEKLS